ncbi:GDSL-type esterase/lipase family protein [Clostridium thermarum]|uniref:GDSL-type esterase/lipase family protein n=1 Tax=Clostridium thermarum TaxID=1716543 RepID=UPI0013D5F0B1|nr:GDSL-type esterase/lipase family protein [Clostridium thermarum]
MKAVCIGDSLTHGYGVPASCCWVNLLQENSQLKIVNKGLNGDYTASLLCRSYRDVISLHPNYTVIMAGTNDFLMGSSVYNVFDNLSLFCKDVIENSIVPIIMNPPCIDEDMAKECWADEIDYVEVNRKTELLGQRLKEFSYEKSISFIDLYKIFKNITTEDHDYYIDGIHLNKRGHLIIYNELMKQKVFQENKKK